MACPGNPNCGKSTKTLAPPKGTTPKQTTNKEIMLNGKIYVPKR